MTFQSTENQRIERERAKRTALREAALKAFLAAQMPRDALEQTQRAANREADRILAGQKVHKTARERPRPNRIDEAWRVRIPASWQPAHSRGRAPDANETILAIKPDRVADPVNKNLGRSKRKLNPVGSLDVTRLTPAQMKRMEAHEAFRTEGERKFMAKRRRQIDRKIIE